MSTDSNNPDRFHSLKIELFLKTTGGELEIFGEKLVKGLDPKKGEEDPLIIPKDAHWWELYHPKIPSWEKNAVLYPPIDSRKVLTAPSIMEVLKLNKHVSDEQEARNTLSVQILDRIEKLTRMTFLTLESAWAQQNMRLIDFKIEFGFTADGELLVADVIDNDSWRLRTKNWTELSKESFRQGENLSEVEKKYGTVSQMVNNFRIPNQALVFWGYSVGDSLPYVNYVYPEKIKEIGIDMIDVALSVHKSPAKALAKLEEILQAYPDGGVIIVKVGRSNGLGPILAARTSWPVIACPASLKDFPEDVWSSLRMPFQVPLLTAWPDENAILAAFNILSQKNPAMYTQIQDEIEELDD